MGLDVADVNGDGFPDLFEVDMQANDPRRLKTQMPTHTSLPKHPGDTPLQLQFQRNSLLVNRGDGTFAEVSNAAGVPASGWSWGTMFLDVDLDGWQDILVANGHPWDIMDADVQEGLQNRLNDVPWQRQRWEFPPLKLRNAAFRNRGDLTFEDASAAWRFGTQEDISHGIASADLDGDGDLDVVVNRLGAPALVLRNDVTAPRIAVRLVGDAPNTRAVGAKVTLYDGAVPLQTREVAVGGLYLSHSDYLMSFAMGRSDSARLEITWRDGRRTTIPRVRANREYEVTQKNAGAKPASDSAADANASARAASLFVDATAQLRGHRHTENTFDDWDRQFLLPNALSQSGPGISWFDVDRDGAEDLIVGTGKGGRVAVFRSVSGALVPHAGVWPGGGQRLHGRAGHERERGDAPAGRRGHLGTARGARHGRAAGGGATVHERGVDRTGRVGRSGFARILHRADRARRLQRGWNARPVRGVARAADALPIAGHVRPLSQRQRRVRHRHCQPRRAAQHRHGDVGDVRRHERRRARGSRADARLGLDRAAAQRRTRAPAAGPRLVGTRAVERPVERGRGGRPGRRRADGPRGDQLGAQHGTGGRQRTTAGAHVRRRSARAARWRCCWAAPMRA